VNPNGLFCLDVGASTGGFTDVLLKRGAKRVYAVDVGTNQLSDELRNNPRVISMEQTDIRDVIPSETADLIVIDVSFISLTNIVESLPRWMPKYVIALIKPQFEVPREVAAKYNGVIKSSQLHDESIACVVAAFEKSGFKLRGVTASPIQGGSGNTEFLACFEL
jgi:23S rRNA (cytidine1920-2'-O)/16S rRNA (cytidine1409-2'-O)-methyltransferase